MARLPKSPKISLRLLFTPEKKRKKKSRQIINIYFSTTFVKSILNTGAESELTVVQPWWMTWSA